MAIMKDETFGPVVGITSVDDDEQALQLMNDSDYGLVSTRWRIALKPDRFYLDIFRGSRIV
jgi:acyl-CoA reductase-like NAD-dependent aldehyde dehydrogenase